MSEIEIFQYLIITKAGEVIIDYSYNSNSSSDSAKVFFSAISSSPPSFFTISSIQYFWFYQSDIYFVITSSPSSSPFSAFRFLSRSIRVFSDYLGSVLEASLRVNFLLIYEILDELCTFGILSDCTSTSIKPRVKGNPVLTERGSLFDEIKDLVSSSSRSFASAKRSILSSRNETLDLNYNNLSLEGAPGKSVLKLGSSAEKGNELYIDVEESLRVVLDINGSVKRGSILGKVKTRSFLKGPEAIAIEFTPVAASSLGQKELHGLGVEFVNSALTPSRFSGDQMVNNSEGFSEGRVEVVLEEGEKEILKYSKELGEGEDWALPVEAESSFGNEAGENCIEMIVALRNVSKISLSDVKIGFFVPDVEGVGEVFARYTEANDNYNFEFDEDKKYASWNIKVVKNKKREIAKFVVQLERSYCEEEGFKEDVMENMSSILVDFVGSGFTPSRFKINSVDSLDGNEEMKKWVRYTTYVENLEKRI